MHYWSLACSTADFLYMTANLLTLNSSQTEFLLIALEQQPAKTNLLTCQQPLSLLTLLVLSFLIYFAGVLQIKLFYFRMILSLLVHHLVCNFHRPSLLQSSNPD